MRHAILRTIAAIVISTCALAALPVHAATPPNDHTLIVDALNTMYAAASTDDLVKFRTVAASDF